MEQKTNNPDFINDENSPENGFELISINKASYNGDTYSWSSDAKGWFKDTPEFNIDDKAIYLSGGDWKIGRLKEIIAEHTAKHPQPKEVATNSIEGDLLEGITQGVWEVVDKHTGRLAIAVNHNQPEKSNTICSINGYSEDEEIKANANLITNAPRLLKENTYLLEQNEKLMGEKMAAIDVIKSDGEIIAGAAKKVLELRQRVLVLEDALRPLAELDLEGVNTSMEGNVVYQRNQTYINVGDVYKAQKAISVNSSK